MTVTMGYTSPCLAQPQEIRVFEIQNHDWPITCRFHVFDVVLTMYISYTSIYISLEILDQKALEDSSDIYP